MLEKNRLQPPAASEVQRAVAPLILGDLEPDGDDNAMAIQEINLKLMQSNLRMNSLDNNVRCISVTTNFAWETLTRMTCFPIGTIIYDRFKGSIANATRRAC